MLPDFCKWMIVGNSCVDAWKDWKEKQTSGKGVIPGHAQIAGMCVSRLMEEKGDDAGLGKDVMEGKEGLVGWRY